MVDASLDQVRAKQVRRKLFPHETSRRAPDVDILKPNFGLF
jgi:hypothetical protein